MSKLKVVWRALCLLIIATLMLGLPVLAADGAPQLRAGDEAWVARDDAARLREAIESYEKAVSQDPNDYEALWRLARAYEWKGKQFKGEKQERLAILEKGKAYAERAIKTNDRGAEGHYWLGALLGRIGETKGILNSLAMVKPMKAEMDRVVALDPEYAGAHYVLSLLYWKVPGRPLSIGDKSKALEEAKLAVRLDPTDTQYRLGLGEAHLALKDKAAAKREFQAVLAMPATPDDPVQSALDKKDADEYLADLSK